MTTLELARAIADAVIAAADLFGRCATDQVDQPTQAVLDTLSRNDSWFCRLTEDENGITREEILPLQPELFK